MRAKVGRWGRSLALRIPHEIAKTAGLSEGEQIEIETRDGDLLIRRPAARERADAAKAAEEIIAESRRFSLSDDDIRQLIDAGRKR